MVKNSKIIVGISCGDINGIGLEVILNTFSDKRMLDFCTPVIFSSLQTVNFYKKIINNHTPLHSISSLDKIAANKINVFNCWNEEVKIELGKNTKEGGVFAAKSLSSTIDALKNNSIDFLLTAPIHKETIQSEEFRFPGHTEFLEHNLEGESLMILMQEN